MGDVEIKTTTHYRDRVATYGSAAYGNGRIDNKNEKKREIRRLSYKRYLFKPVEKERCPRVKQVKVKKEMESMFNHITDTIRFTNEGWAKREFAINNWRRDILRITPRYLSAAYDEKEDVIKVEYLGTLQNVIKFYSETSVIAIRNEVKEKIAEIERLGLLPDKPLIITITRSQYQDFVRNEMKPLQSKIEAELRNEQPVEAEAGIPK